MWKAHPLKSEKIGFSCILFGYITYKVVANFDFLNLFAINFFNDTDKDFVNQSVQYNLVQFCDCGILSDFLDKLDAYHISFIEQEAVELLGWAEIECTVCGLNGFQAE